MIGYLFLNSLPASSTLIGAGIVALAGIFTLWCDQRQLAGAYRARLFLSLLIPMAPRGQRRACLLSAPQEYSPRS